MDETARHSIYVQDLKDPPHWPALSGARRTTVAVIGGGITGLSTALHLAEAGTAVVLLEAHQPGWGASGRNGGQLNPGLKYDPSQMIAKLGPEAGQRLVAFAWSSVQQTAHLINRLGIDCDLRLNGTLRAAARAADVAGVRASQQDMAGHGMPVEWLEPAEMARLTGHDHYHGGFLDRRGGDLEPLRYSHGLAKAATAAGAVIFGDSRAQSLTRQGAHWRITTAGGSLIADRVLVCCNGYADGLVPGLKQSVVPVFSSALATAPLPAALSEKIMPGRHVLYESGLVTVYYRVDAKNRLILGGRGPMRPVSRPSALRPIARHAYRLWPELASMGWQAAWNGRVAVTTDHLPHLHQPAEGLLTMGGYNGRGVALATAVGRALAPCLAGEIEAADLPLPLSPLQPIRFHSFWPVGAHATIAWSRLKASLSR
ncbi:FAD-binding oxidoreductase [Pseudomonas sp. GX19020]|uniref:NAD(P)/FAD-dependent oxidoreductase n=1 Tax=Pseudomonas sp. GX19020 TaxID=2942277 RepID=UPI002018A6D1|nr:FAD-binding oxidoreductase [Pseudomonas sp. GX19020]MCL4068004.1 FAD-binding oxidoreductase [Pseudomonas sp. GX19020]